MKNDEEKLEEFLDKFLSEKAPNYSDMNNNRELVKIVELSMLLKRGDFSVEKSFKSGLELSLTAKLNKIKGPDKKTEVLSSKRFAFNMAHFALVLSTFFMFLKSVGNTRTSKGNALSKSRSLEYVFMYYSGNYRNSLKLLYNRRNNAILYWPFGQFTTFQ